MKKKAVLIIIGFIVAASIVGVIALGKKHTHVFNEQVAGNEYFYSEATCTQKAKYYYSCKCGEKGTGTFEYGTYKHSFTNYVYNNDATCTNDGTKTAKCDLCDATDTLTATRTKLQHTYDVKNTAEEYLITAATCTSPAIYRYSCACGDKGYSWETFEANKVEGHKMVNGKCSECGAPYSTGLKYKLDGEGYAVDGIGECEDTDIIIPETYNGLPVIAIDAYAFDNCKSIINVTIPNGVTTIGRNAFDRCSSLEYVKIPGSVKSIESKAFAACTYLIYAIIGNGVEEIGEKAFQDCLRLKDIDIPSSVISVGDEAFNNCKTFVYNQYDNGLYLGNEDNPYHLLVKAVSKDITSCIVNSQCKIIHCNAFNTCSNLASVTLPDGLKSIESCAFANCIELNDVTIPDSVTNVGRTAFSYCVKLTNIKLPNGLKTIGSNTFYFAAFTEIEIPASVTEIERYAFYYCDRLTKIIFKGTMAQWRAIVKGEDWKYKVPSSCVVQCVDGNLSI